MLLALVHGCVLVDESITRTSLRGNCGDFLLFREPAIRGSD